MTQTAQTAATYAWPEAGLEPALRWLDCIVEREIVRLRGRYELSLDELRGLYISDERVDQLVRDRLAAEDGREPVRELRDRARALHAAYRASAPFADVTARLRLSAVETDLLLLALAPEIDLRYETLFAYLNNDIARRNLTADLAQRLLAGSQSDCDLCATAVRTLLSPAAALLAQGALEPLEPAAGASSLQHAFVVAPTVSQAILRLPIADARWPREVRWLDTTQVDAQAPPVATHAALYLLSGEEPEELRALARQVAQTRRWPLLGTTAAALARDPALGARLRLAVRLATGAIVVDGIGDEATGATAGFARECAREEAPLILVTRAESPLAEALGDLPHVRMGTTLLEAGDRARRWTAALRRARLPMDDALVERLSQCYALSGSRIDAVVDSIAADAGREGLCAALEREASARSNDALARLAPRIARPHRWNDLILSDNALQQLREVAQAIACRERVYRRWGLVERTGRSTGLMIFFSGASGTGKTMAASVIANEAGLELFRIDLASVVSKYIGETEKNLERIFASAKRSSAILLFDEADALLGKRSEINDAHDRYANIEVAYLLQKMEEHDGVVILASNLAKNLDPAFARRMHYALEFARPNAPLRERLWRGMFPRRAPLADDIDFAFLAERFETTGGEIQTIALDAAFLAAAAHMPIGMAHLMHAITRRQTKHGNPGGLERYREHRRAMNARPMA